MVLTAAEQKANLYGAGALEVRELLEMVAGKEFQCRVKDLAGKTVYEVQQMGLTPKQAGRVVAAIELGRRAQEPEIGYQNMIDSPKASAVALSSLLSHSEVEKFAVLVLDNKNRLLGVEEITVGSKTETLAPPSEIFRRVLSKGGVRLIVGHNHPSGSLEPSPEDLRLTEQLLQGGKALDLPVLDHLILGNGDWASLRQTTEIWSSYQMY
jgi:DNA repair protein RadC